MATIEQRLTDMLRNRPDALGSKQVFTGLLKDFFPQERIMVQLMLALHDMGIHTEIERAACVTRDFAYRFAKRLTDEHGTDRCHAENTVNLFCVCYAEAIGRPCDALATSAPQAGMGAPQTTPTTQTAPNWQSSPVQTGQQAGQDQPPTLQVTLGRSHTQPARPAPAPEKKWYQHWLVPIVGGLLLGFFLGGAGRRHRG